MNIGQSKWKTVSKLRYNSFEGSFRICCVFVQTEITYSVPCHASMEWIFPSCSLCPEFRFQGTPYQFGSNVGIIYVTENIITFLFLEFHSLSLMHNFGIMGKAASNLITYPLFSSLLLSYIPPIGQLHPCHQSASSHPTCHSMPTLQKATKKWPTNTYSSKDSKYNVCWTFNIQWGSSRKAKVVHNNNKKKKRHTEPDKILRCLRNCLANILLTK